MSTSFDAWLRISRGNTDRSHPQLVRLDALAQATTYPGWEEDFSKAEKSILSASVGGLSFDRYIHLLMTKQCLHEGDRSHPRLVELDALTLTYPEWQSDVEQAEKYHCQDFDDLFCKSLKAMQKKQSAFLGDRSHPQLVQLDTLAQATTYPGWEEDISKAEKSILSASVGGLSFDRYIHLLMTKQCLYEGDRSHPRLVELDALTLTYPEWQSDVKQAEKYHCQDFDDLFCKSLKAVQKKQSAFLGDRSHPQLVRLDALAQATTYPGWEEDISKAEKSILSASAGGLSFDRYIHLLTTKQCMHEGDRSHPRLAELDALTLTYPEWQSDVEQAEKYHCQNFDDLFCKSLKAMQMKQQAFQSSHQNVFQTLPGNTTPNQASTRTQNAPGMCIICLEKQRSHVFVPCGHVATCEACAAASMLRDRNRCPVCRQPADTVMRLYFP